MPYIVNHIPLSTPKSRRPQLPMTAKSITVHSTANPNSTARNERDNLARVENTRQASFHLVVDQKECIECIPLNEVSWHAADGFYGEGNRTSISLEICESGDRAKTLENAAVILAGLLKERNWGVDKLKRHYDWSGKDCPRIMSANNWFEWYNFTKRVQNILLLMRFL